MQIACLTATFHLSGCNSLKEKRQRLGGLHQKLGRNPHTALCESGGRDQHGEAEWTILVTGQNRKEVDQRVSDIENVLLSFDAQLIGLVREWL